MGAAFVNARGQEWARNGASDAPFLFCGGFLLRVAMAIPYAPKSRSKVRERERRVLKHYLMVARRHFDAAKQYIRTQHRHLLAVDLRHPAGVIDFVQGQHAT